MTKLPFRVVLYVVPALVALVVSLAACTHAPGAVTASPSPRGSASSGGTADPSGAGHQLLHSKVEHVVVLFLENHSFDNVLGRLCAEVRQGTLDRAGEGMACDGATEGVNLLGDTVPLQRSPDIV